MDYHISPKPRRAMTIIMAVMKSSFILALLSVLGWKIIGLMPANNIAAWTYIWIGGLLLLMFTLLIVGFAATARRR